VWTESAAGQLQEKRERVRRSFGDFRHKIWWDNLDAMYFAGYALWNYLTMPFLLMHQDVVVEEVDNWQERGEKWRCLQVLFPEAIPTHSREQLFYFDNDKLLRRHDYTAEVFGGWAKAAHYSSEHKLFGGFVFPTRRQVFPRKPDRQPNRLITLVNIEIDDIDLQLKEKD
jgi:hypothetical protein